MSLGRSWPRAKAARIDLLYGIGGTPEAVLAAAAIRCLGGQIQGRLWTRTDEERQAAVEQGYDLESASSPATTWCAARTYSSQPPASRTEICWKASATAAPGATTESLVMRSRSGTVPRRSFRAQPREARLADRGHRGGLRSAPRRNGLRGTRRERCRRFAHVLRRSPAIPPAAAERRRRQSGRRANPAAIRSDPATTGA